MAPPQPQEEGWPFGLAAGGKRELLPGRSVSLNTLISASPIHSASTRYYSTSDSDSDSESTGSFFHVSRTTLGSLIRAPSNLDLSKRSSLLEKSNTAIFPSSNKHNVKSKPDLLWSFSVCCRDSRDVEVVKNYRNAPAARAPTLSHYLAAERRKSDRRRRRRRWQLSPGELLRPYAGLGLTGLTPEWNTLFVDGRIAPPPPRLSPWSGSDADHGGRGPVIFPWVCSRQS